MLFEKPKEEYPSSLKGYFIISETNMPDPNFFQTVVLIMEHNEEGAFGLVVNRLSSLKLSDIMPRFTSSKARSTPIFVGGPVQQEYLFTLHSRLPGELTVSSIEPVPGVVFEPAFGNLEHFFQDENWEALPTDLKPNIHLFLGYSGWAPGQLEQEMEQGSWMILPANSKIVFLSDPQMGWKEALREKGGIYRVFADSNQTPNMN